MGKGDRRTRRGKIWRGTHGKTRPWAREKKRGTKKAIVLQAPPPQPQPPQAQSPPPQKTQAVK